MNNLDQTRFNQLYEKHTNALILQGKSEKTIEMYSRSIRRLSQFFDLCPDHLTTDQLKQYFLALVKSHSWSTAHKLFMATNKASYLVFFFTLYSMDWRLGKGLRQEVEDIDADRGLIIRTDNLLLIQNLSGLALQFTRA